MKKFNIIFGIFISVISLYITFRGVEYNKIIDSFSKINWIYFFPALIFVVLILIFRVIRWKYMLNKFIKADFKNVFISLSLCNFFNYILPARMGELARLLVLSKKTNSSRSSILLSIIIERLFDSATLVLMMYIIFYFKKFSNRFMELSDIALWLHVIAILLIILFYIFRKYVISILTFFTKKNEKIQNFVNEKINLLYKGFRCINSVKSFSYVLFSSLFIWFLTVLSIYMLILAFNMNMGLLGALIVIISIGLAVMFPSAPGFIGTMQIAIIIALGEYGYSKELAISFSIVYHMTQYFIFISFGIWALFAGGMNFSTIKHEVEEN